MYSVPMGSTATAPGEVNWVMMADAGTVPVPAPLGPLMPAMVVMTPEAVTMRMELLPVSAM